MSRVANTQVYYLGGLLITALIIGGGTNKALSTDFLLQLLVIPALLWVIYRHEFKQTPYLKTTCLVVLFAACTPLALSSARTFGFDIGTADIGRTLDSVIFLVIGIVVFCFTLHLSEMQRARIAQFLLIGVAINIAFSIAQFSAQQTAVTLSGFPFSVEAGFFEVGRHLQALLLVAIPFIMLAFKNTTWWFLSVPLALALALYQFLLGSTAGVLAGLVCVMAGLGIVTSKAPVRIGAAGAAILGTACLTYFIPELLTTELAGGQTWARLQLAATTAQQAYLPFGSGYGTFDLVYPQYGAQDRTALAFPNHAHNDYLELGIEGGVIVIALLVVYVAGFLAMIARGGLTDFQKAAALGIAVLLVQSLMDYPLRTLGLAMVFSYLNAIVFAGVFSKQQLTA